jgi:hypothetical protein
MRKGFAWAGLSVVAAAFTVGLVHTESAIAEVAFSINKISKEISQSINQTDFPILLPSEDVLDRNKSRVGGGSILYAYVGTRSENEDYSVVFNNYPGNPGNAAFRFSFSATKGGKIEKMPPNPDPNYQAKYAQVQLFDGSNALATSWCGGTACWSTVQWKSNNILYKVVSKLRKSDAAIEIANSAIKAGNRNYKKKAALPSSNIESLPNGEYRYSAVGDDGERYFYYLQKEGKIISVVGFTSGHDVSGSSRV